jgi:hypothetical protein
MNRVLDRISREPVLGFGAIALSIAAWWPSLVSTDAKKAALAGILLWLQRTFTTSRKTADENVEGAKYVGAVEHQAIATAAQVIAASAPPATSTATAVPAPPPEPPSVADPGEPPDPPPPQPAKRPLKKGG